MKNLTTEDTENTERENDLQCELAAWELLREARELLASAKITRDHIIKRGIEMQKERDEAREALDCLLAVIGLTPICWEQRGTSRGGRSRIGCFEKMGGPK
jgi:hypothetical protein